MELKKIRTVRSLKCLKNNLPYYILYSLNRVSNLYCSILPPEASFLKNKNDLQWQQVVKWAKEISTESITTDTVLTLIYEGWLHFKGKDIHAFLYSAENLRSQKLSPKYVINGFHLVKCILRGTKDLNWYADTVTAFKEELLDYDIDILLKIFAITSPQAYPAYNLFQTLKAYEHLINPSKSLMDITCFEVTRNMLFEIETDTFADNLEKTTRMKVANFYKALLGDENAVVVDGWMLRACLLGKIYFWKATERYYLKCRKLEYDFISYYIRFVASFALYTPIQITAMVWSGARIIYADKNQESDMRKNIRNFRQKGYVKTYTK